MSFDPLDITAGTLTLEGGCSNYRSCVVGVQLKYYKMVGRNENISRNLFVNVNRRQNNANQKKKQEFYRYVSSQAYNFIN